jgi:hypothetical protein
MNYLLAVALVTCTARSAHAQWTGALEGDAPAPTADPATAWTAELKIGRYRPRIDHRFSAPPGQGPFGLVYGARPMTLVLAEVDRSFAIPGGGIGISLAGGYTYRAASGFEVDDSGELVHDAAGEPLRYTGYRTVFRLYPITAGAVYRLTVLDDHWRVPVVPYGKLGLAGYVWQFLRPADNVERVVESPACSTGPCLADRTRGVTLGWQWTVGVAVRIEKLDPWVVREMRGDGIRHVAVFVELVGARVDGFGAESALDLGDTMWLAGMNMEF